MTGTTQQTSSKAVNNAIRKALRSDGTAKTNIQAACIAVMAHAQKFNDCSGAGRLVQGLKTGADKSLVSIYFQRYSPIMVYTEPKTKEKRSKMRKEESDKFNPFDMAKAKANPWFDMPEANKELPDYTADDFKQQLTSMLERWENNAKGEGNRDVVKKDNVIILDAVKAARSAFYESFPQETPVIDADNVAASGTSA